MSHTPPSPRPPRTGTPRSRRLALTVLSAAMLMTILDGSIVTVAMPAIQRDLGFSPAGLSWTVNAYLIAFGGLLLLAGRLGDLIGRKAMFLAGNAVFTAASLLAGAATGPGMLIAARFLQGVGSAMASAVVLGILVTLFTGAEERAKAIGVFSFTGAAGASIGQVLGGVLTDALSWNWIFFINLPIGLATIVLAIRALPDERGAGLAAGFQRDAGAPHEAVAGAGGGRDAPLRRLTGDGEPDPQEFRRPVPSSGRESSQRMRRLPSRVMISGSRRALASSDMPW
ncbi:Major Facilitator Superfamily protein [Streptosporangium canum]|uniref:Major Facilitator Superfamily protein n=1 Tax=Streptosporangium canum TaxID=324952 RepID=A0A1I4A3F1_9ACTN|nr:Major Facilitator Superfamily protein [Streptosporangium canum]